LRKDEELEKTIYPPWQRLHKEIKHGLPHGAKEKRDFDGARSQPLREPIRKVKFIREVTVG
jgi:hypothetical protein